MMRMSKKSYDNMNLLATMCFDANAIVDNLAYCLDFYYYNEIAKIVHQNVAHVMPEWADIVTEKMLELNGRPTRGAIGHYEEDYKDLKEIFKVLDEMLLKIRIHVINLIDEADINDDAEVRIFGEDFLVRVSNYIKQADEWVNASEKLNDWDLNNHIKDYTHFLAI